MKASTGLLPSIERPFAARRKLCGISADMPWWAGRSGLRTVIGIFGPLTSVKTRCFDAGDEAAGWEWIGGKPVDSG